MKQSIKFKTLEVDVEFGYTPPEREVRYYPDGSGYPGSNAEIDIATISFKEENITAFFEETGLIYSLEKELLKNLEGNEQCE